MARKGRQPIFRLTMADIEFIAFSLAKELMEGDEPIPPFDTRFPDKLESCVATPFQTFGGKSLYKGVTKKAAILFYLMVKNHPFQNGNKRMAVAALLLFLYRNRRWLSISNENLYEFAKYVASSDPRDKEKIIRAIEIVVKTKIVPLEKAFDYHA
jgi:death-on-curing family protein